jgi:hypothetical protein
MGSEQLQNAVERNPRKREGRKIFLPAVADHYHPLAHNEFIGSSKIDGTPVASRKKGVKLSKSTKRSPNPFIF